MASARSTSSDGALTGAYRALAVRLADVLPEPPGGGGAS